VTAVGTDIRPDHIARGIALILLSTFFTALQDAIFKHASADVTLWQVYVLRSLLLIPAFLAISFIWGNGAATWHQSLRLWPMLRAALFVLMYFSMYSAIPIIPLSAVAAGIYTAPLFVAALSPLLLREPVRWRGLLGIAVGFAGVLVILRPGTEAFTWLMLLPILAGLFYALSAIVTRSKCRSIRPSTLALSLSIALLLTGVLASTALYIGQLAPEQVAVSPFLLGSWSWLDLWEWGFVAMLAVLMVGNGLVLPAAYQSAPSVIIATFDYTYLIFATVLGVVLFSEIPDTQTVMGIIMIAGAGLIVAR
jgi:drug/metabolite transporter (DMT)-like permease